MRWVVMTPESEFPNLRVDRVLDPQSGAVALSVWLNDQRVPLVRVTGRRAERVSGLTLIQKDLKNAGRWVVKAAEQAMAMRGDSEAQFIQFQDREVADQIKALFVAALTFYGKAFTEAAGRRAQASRDWLDESFRERHDYFMMFRHNMAAHSGDEQLEKADSHLLLMPNASLTQSPVQLFTNRFQPDIAWADDDTDKFSSLIAHVIEKVEAKHKGLSDAICEAALMKGAAFWQQAVQQGNSVDADSLFPVDKSDANAKKAIASWLSM